MIETLRFSHAALFTTVLTLAMFALVGSAGAVTIGQNCASTTGGPQTAFQNTISGGATYVSPINGILTRWGINRAGTPSDSMSALIVGQISSPAVWSVVSSTPYVLTKASVVTEQDIRLPIAAGQTIGLNNFGSSGAMCGTGNPGDTVAYASNYVTPGNTFSENTASPYRLAIWANVEPDADNDGYGDETQDKCPQSAALQNPCPVLTISQSLSSIANNIYVKAASSYTTALTASVSVKVPKLGKKKAATVKFKSRATTVAAGVLKQIRLKFPTRLVQARAALAKGKKLKATITLSGTGLANSASVTGSTYITR